DNRCLISGLRRGIELRIGPTLCGWAAEVVEQQTCGKTGLRVLAADADDGAAGAMRVVVDQPQEIFLPIEKFELLPGVVAPGGGAKGLDELNDVRRATRIARRSPPPSRHRTSPLCPKVASPGPAPSVSRPRAIAAGNAA